VLAGGFPAVVSERPSATFHPWFKPLVTPLDIHVKYVAC